MDLLALVVVRWEVHSKEPGSTLAEGRAEDSCMGNGRETRVEEGKCGSGLASVRHNVQVCFAFGVERKRMAALVEVQPKP